MNSQAIRERVNKDLTEARRMGIRAIPTVFINGKILRNRSFSSLEKMIEAELKKTR